MDSGGSCVTPSSPLPAADRCPHPHAVPCAAADTVRVKAMNARLEEDVSVSELPTYLLAALHPHGTAPPGPGRPLQHAGGSRVGDDGDAGGEQEEPSAHGGRERQRRGGRR